MLGRSLGSLLSVMDDLFFFSPLKGWAFEKESCVERLILRLPSEIGAIVSEVKHIGNQRQPRLDDRSESLEIEAGARAARHVRIGALDPRKNGIMMHSGQALGSAVLRPCPAVKTPCPAGVRR